MESAQKKLEEILAMSALKEEIKSFRMGLKQKQGKMERIFPEDKSADRRSPGTCP